MEHSLLLFFTTMFSILQMDLNKTDSQLTNISEDCSSKKSMDKCATMTEQAKSRNVLRVSQTPRIDISRASSSSQHEDSRDSSPENVFDQVGTGTLQEGNETSDLGFVEDGANDLRRSTEELYFNQDDKSKEKTERECEQVIKEIIINPKKS